MLKINTRVKEFCIIDCDTDGNVEFAWSFEEGAGGLHCTNAAVPFDVAKKAIKFLESVGTETNINMFPPNECASTDDKNDNVDIWEAIRKALKDGEPITAMKILREAVQCDLRSAKLMIDAIRN